MIDSSHRTVWLIEDEKYGVQMACTTEEIAEAHLATGKYHRSGAGSTVTKWQLTDTMPKGKP